MSSSWYFHFDVRRIPCPSQQFQSNGEQRKPQHSWSMPRRYLVIGVCYVASVPSFNDTKYCTWSLTPSTWTTSIPFAKEHFNYYAARDHVACFNDGKRIKGTWERYGAWWGPHWQMLFLAAYGVVRDFLAMLEYECHYLFRKHIYGPLFYFTNIFNYIYDMALVTRRWQ